VSAQAKRHSAFSIKQRPHLGPIKKMSGSNHSGTATSSNNVGLGTPIFTGGTQDARRWVKNMVTSLRRAGLDHAQEFMEEFDGHLGVDAADWAENDHQVAALIAKGDQATSNDVDELTKLFLQQYPRVDPGTQEDPMKEVQQLEQGDGEGFKEYYMRASKMLNKTQVPDIAEATTVQNKFVLQHVTDHWIKGLRSVALKVRVKKDYVPTQGQVRTLRRCYLQALETNREMKEEAETLLSQSEKEEHAAYKEYVTLTATNRPVPAALRQRVGGFIGQPLEEARQQARTAPPIAASAYAPPAPQVGQEAQMPAAMRPQQQPVPLRPQPARTAQGGTNMPSSSSDSAPP
jgi:hypothetical protein